MAATITAIEESNVIAEGPGRSLPTAQETMRRLMFIACVIFSSVGTASAEPCARGKAEIPLLQTRISKPVPAVIPARDQAGHGLSRAQALRRLHEQGFVVIRLAQDSEGTWLGEVTQGRQRLDTAVDPAGRVITWR